MRKWPLALAVSASAFVFLAFEVFGTDEMAFEQFWANPLREHRSPFNVLLAHLVTTLGDGWFLLVLTLILLRVVKDPWEKVTLVRIYLLQLVGNYLLKSFFARARPGDDFDPLVHERFYSFPSGHAMAATAVYGFLAWMLARHGHPRWALALLIVPILVGFTRIFLGAHYPTDVVGGFLAGMVVIAGVQLTRRAHGDRHRPVG